MQVFYYHVNLNPCHNLQIPCLFSLHVKLMEFFTTIIIKMGSNLHFKHHPLPPDWVVALLSLAIWGKHCWESDAWRAGPCKGSSAEALLGEGETGFWGFRRLPWLMHNKRSKTVRSIFTSYIYIYIIYIYIYTFFLNIYIYILLYIIKNIQNALYI